MTGPLFAPSPAPPDALEHLQSDRRRARQTLRAASVQWSVEPTSSLPPPPTFAPELTATDAPTPLFSVGAPQLTPGESATVGPRLRPRRWVRPSRRTRRRPTSASRRSPSTNAR